MKDIERELKQCELATPSADLDRRIEQLLAHAPAPRWRFLTRPIALWQCAAACLGFALIGYFANREATQPQQAPETPTTVYIIQSGTEAPRRASDTSMREHVFLSDPGKVKTYIIAGNGETEGENT